MKPTISLVREALYEADRLALSNQQGQRFIDLAASLDGYVLVPRKLADRLLERVDPDEYRCKGCGALYGMDPNITLVPLVSVADDECEPRVSLADLDKGTP